MSISPDAAGAYRRDLTRVRPSAPPARARRTARERACAMSIRANQAINLTTSRRSRSDARGAPSGLTTTPRPRTVHGRAVFLPHHAVLHHGHHLRQRDDVEQRIAIDDDDVGQLARFD